MPLLGSRNRPNRLFCGSGKPNTPLGKVLSLSGWADHAQTTHNPIFIFHGKR